MLVASVDADSAAGKGGLKARDVARRHIDDADDQTIDEISLRIAGNLRARPFLPERPEINLDLVGRIARALERLDRKNAADAHSGEIELDAAQVVRVP